MHLQSNTTVTLLTASSHRRPGRFGGLLFALAALLGFDFAGAPAHAQPSALLAGFEGIYSGWTPADPIVAAGPSSLVTMVSGKIAVFNKQGTKLFEQNLGAGGFWAAQGGDAVPEPWVIYDPHTGRFVAVATEVASNKGVVYLAISKHSNPILSTDWYKHALNLTGTHQVPAYAGEPTYPTGPKAAVDQQTLYLTANHFGINGNIFSHNQIIAIAKAPLLSGGSPGVAFQQGFASLFGPLHPVTVLDAAAPMYFLTQDPNVDTVSIYALSDALTSPVLSLATVTVSAFDQPPSVPQLGSESPLYSVGSRLLSGVMRNGSLWTAHAISDPTVESGGKAVVRWYEFDVSAYPTSGAVVVQSGIADAGPGVHTWLPAVNLDAEGNLGLCFSVGSANQYAAIGYTGRLWSDAPGYTHPAQIARNGSGPFTILSRWGDYGGLAMDPDGYTFWLCHIYPIKQKGNGGAWRTFVGAFEVAPPAPPSDPLHVGDLDGSPANQSGQKWRATVTVTMHDGAEAAVPGAQVSIEWSTGVTATATTDTNGRCTFTLSNLSKQTNPSVTLTITDATHATLSYSAAANHETSITVNKP